MSINSNRANNVVAWLIYSNFYAFHKQSATKKKKEKKTSEKIKTKLGGVWGDGVSQKKENFGL